jgi:hypothetical protein
MMIDFLSRLFSAVPRFFSTDPTTMPSEGGKGTHDRARVTLACIDIKRDHDVYHDGADDDSHDASCVRPFRVASREDNDDDEAKKRVNVNDGRRRFARPGFVRPPPAGAPRCRAVQRHPVETRHDVSRLCQGGRCGIQRPSRSVRDRRTTSTNVDRPPTVAFMTCILAVLVIALLGKDRHGLLLAQMALNAPFAVTSWWLGEQGHAVCFVILALRTFFGAHLSGRFDALLNCFATLGLLVITAPNLAWVWRDTLWAQWLNVGICVYRLVTHTKAGDGGDTGSREKKHVIFFAAFIAKIGLLCLALPGIGLFNGFF